MSVHQLNTALDWAANINECELANKVISRENWHYKKEEEEEDDNNNSSIAKEGSNEHDVIRNCTPFGNSSSTECVTAKPVDQKAKTMTTSKKCHSSCCNCTELYEESSTFHEHPYGESSTTNEPKSSGYAASLQLQEPESMLSSSSSSQLPPTPSMVFTNSPVLPTSTSPSFSSSSSSLARSFCVYPSVNCSKSSDADCLFTVCSCSSAQEEIKTSGDSSVSSSAALEQYLHSFTNATKEYLASSCTTLPKTVVRSPLSPMLSSSSSSTTTTILTNNYPLGNSFHEELNQRRKRSSHRLNVRPSSAPSDVFNTLPANGHNTFTSYSNRSSEAQNLNKSFSLLEETTSRSLHLSSESNNYYNDSDDNYSKTVNNKNNNNNNYNINNNEYLYSHEFSTNNSTYHNHRACNAEEEELTIIKNHESTCRKSEHVIHGEGNSLTRPPLAPSPQNIKTNCKQTNRKNIVFLQKVFERKRAIVNNYTRTNARNNKGVAKDSTSNNFNSNIFVKRPSLHRCDREKGGIVDDVKKNEFAYAQPEADDIKNNNNNNENSKKSNNNYYLRQSDQLSMMNESTYSSAKKDDSDNEINKMNTGNALNKDNKENNYSMKVKATCNAQGNPEHVTSKSKSTKESCNKTSKILYRKCNVNRLQEEINANSKRRLEIAEHLNIGDGYCVERNYAAAELSYSRAINLSWLNSFLVMKRAYVYLQQSFLEVAELDLRWVLYIEQVKNQIHKVYAKTSKDIAAEMIFTQVFWLMAELMLLTMHSSTSDVNYCRQKAIEYYEKALMHCTIIDVTEKSLYNPYNYSHMESYFKHDSDTTITSNNKSNNTSDCSCSTNDLEMKSKATSNSFHRNHINSLPDYALETDHNVMCNNNNKYFTNFIVAYRPNTFKKQEQSKESNHYDDSTKVNNKEEDCYQGKIIVNTEHEEAEELYNIQLWTENVNVIRSLLEEEKNVFVTLTEKYCYHVKREEWREATHDAEQVIALLNKQQEAEELAGNVLFVNNSWLIALWKLKQVDVMLFYAPSLALQYLEEMEKSSSITTSQLMFYYLKARVLFYTSHDKETTDECLRLLSQCENVNNIETAKLTMNIKQFALWSSNAPVAPNELYESECNALNRLLTQKAVFNNNNNNNSGNEKERRLQSLSSSSLKIVVTKTMSWLKNAIQEFMEHRDLGNSNYLHGKYNTSVRHYNICLSLDPHNKSLLATTQCNLAAVEINRKHYWKALEHVNSAISLYKCYNNNTERNDTAKRDTFTHTVNKLRTSMNREHVKNDNNHGKVDNNGNDSTSDNDGIYNKEVITNLTNEENLSKAFARRGRIYLQLFLRNVMLPSSSSSSSTSLSSLSSASTSKSNNDEDILRTFTRKAEEYDDKSEADESSYEYDKKYKLTDATSRYQLNCITYSIKDFKCAIHLTSNKSNDSLQMLYEQLNKAEAQREHFVQRWSHVKRNETNWTGESNNADYSNTTKFTKYSNATTNNSFSNTYNSRSYSFATFASTPSTLPHSPSYTSFRYKRPNSAAASFYSSSLPFPAPPPPSSSPSSSSSSYFYTQRPSPPTPPFTSSAQSEKDANVNTSANKSERAKLLKFLHLVEMPDSLLSKTSSASSTSSPPPTTTAATTATAHSYVGSNNNNNSSKTSFTNTDANFNQSHNSVYGSIGSSNNKSFINSVYKKAALRWHPDRWSNASEHQRRAAEQRFKEINTLYHELQEFQR